MRNFPEETVERSFSRTVRVPKGIHKDRIECHIDDKGHFLVIQGWKTPADQLEKRNLPIADTKPEEKKKENSETNLYQYQG
ncbi:hypothetical protein DdX_17995 [Ditylenchus destructor]|uniref:SHSP domain-containing protein n=1 Tax=Ditylenchus destructor TaxID=166010 RepID=A0AAD4MQC8_9BILA|nr:hypothetical protein DdX_17992 [Ditylenchus destructor]KAI1698287.1 hypothetical protein DdX_17995 [Ditylenchus destructor]